MLNIVAKNIIKKAKKKMINLGIFAHVDAGKTTITENFLYFSGAKRNIGNVDKGSTTTDSLEIEKLRGISIRSATVSFNWKNAVINLIDTPGHIDFSAEVERVFNVLDAAILVVSAIDGVQAHTYSLWQALQDNKIPTIIFINKIDRAGVDISISIEDIKKELDANIIQLQIVDIEQNTDLKIDSVFDGNTQKDIAIIKEQNIETLANFDDKLLSDYLNSSNISDNKIKDLISKHTKKFNVNPLLFGSAKNGVGIHELLDAINNYLPNTETNFEAELSAYIFKIEHNQKLGKLAHIRIFTGKIKNRDTVFNSTQQIEEKVSQIKKQFTNKLEDIDELSAGDIGIVCGMNRVRIGDIIGKLSDNIKNISLNVALLTVQVKAVEKQNYAALANALQELSIEDNMLNFKWLKQEQELHINIMGTVQSEILQSVLKARFNIDAEFTEPTVVYKETPSKIGNGYVKYWMPKPCWAIMKFKIEPAERCSGVVYKSEVSVNDIERKYQNEVERTILKALEQGLKAWEVTDIKITLIEGEDHTVHSNPGDFAIATPMGIMNGLKNTGTTLLEPILDFEIIAAEEHLGKITSDLTNMRAEFANPNFYNNNFNLKGIIPVSTSINYPIKLSSVTGGKGRIRFKFNKYQICTDEQGQIREYKGINPLDESKWILHARGAYKV